MLPLGSHPCAGNLAPHLESLSHFLAIRGGGEPVASRAEVLGNRSIRGEELLGMTRRFEPLHAALALARRLMGVLGAVIEIAVLTMFHTGQYLPLGGAVAFELIRNDDPGHVLAPFQQLAEEL